MSVVKRIGVLTGGGDAPGLNPAIKGLVYRSADYKIEVIGLYGGWRGLLNPLPELLLLDRAKVRRWDRDGGTNLGSTRTNPFEMTNEAGEKIDRSDEVSKNIKLLGLDAIVVCGARIR
ncbi:MAG: 6-phosphofructokinase [Pyrinomonadaceae bacterium]